MTGRVDFYVLKSAASGPRWMLACRLTEKAYLRNLKVVVLSEDDAAAGAFDDLLWTFNERSFVPHRLCRAAGDGDVQTPVHVTADLGTVDGADLLLNLSDRHPAGLERFGRVAEILDADAERLRLGRERFKVYRELKVPMDTHHLDDADA